MKVGRAGEIHIDQRRRAAGELQRRVAARSDRLRAIADEDPEGKESADEEQEDDGGHDDQTAPVTPAFDRCLSALAVTHRPCLRSPSRSPVALSATATSTRACRGRHRGKTRDAPYMLLPARRRPTRRPARR